MELYASEIDWRNFRELQLAEIEAVTSIYPDCVVSVDDESIKCIQDALDVNDWSTDVVSTIKLVLKVSGTGIVEQNHHSDILLELALQPKYPETKLDIRVSHPSLSRQAVSSIQQYLNEEAQKAAGSECMTEIIQGANEKYQQICESDSESPQYAPHATTNTAPTQLGRRWIWFHHIKSKTKRRLIQTWANELDLQGLCKPGYPGVLFVEGSEEACEEYVARLRRLRWKAMALRGEEREELDGATVDEKRRFRRGFEELPENALGVVATAMEEIGKADVFRMSILKMK